MYDFGLRIYRKTVCEFGPWMARGGRCYTPRQMNRVNNTLLLKVAHIDYLTDGGQGRSQKFVLGV